MKTDKIPSGARVTGGWTNTGSGRTHWKQEEEKGIVDIGFNSYVWLKKVFTIFKK